jgi:hypothetical protein
MFKVMCIRDSHKPNEIPNSHWVKKGQIYTVIEMSNLNQQNKLLGFKLEEIDLTPFFPYTYFSSDRFVPFETQEEKVSEEIEILEAV